jgi:hypothetical protein
MNQLPVSPGTDPARSRDQRLKRHGLIEDWRDALGILLLLFVAAFLGAVLSRFWPEADVQSEPEFTALDMRLTALEGMLGQFVQTDMEHAPLVEAAHRGVISPTALPGVYRVEPNVQSPRPVQADPAGRPAAGDAPQTWPTLADVERVHLEKTLAATMHNKSLAAKILGIDRSVLRRKLQRYGLDGSPARGDDAEE